MTLQNQNSMNPPTLLRGMGAALALPFIDSKLP